MRRLQGVIACRSARSHAEMDNGSPALEPVVAGTMEQVGGADGSPRRRRFDPPKKRVVVHDRVREENFVEPAPAEIQRRRVIEGASSAYSRKPHVIGPIPETVSRLRRACLRSGSCNLSCCLGLVCALDFCGRRLLRPGFGRAECKQNRDEHRASPPKSHPKAFPPPDNFPSVPLWKGQIVCKPSRVVKSAISDGNGFSGAHGDRRQCGSPGGSACN